MDDAIDDPHDGGHRLDAFNQRAVQRPEPVRPIPTRAWADPDADNMFGSKSEIEVQIVPQGPDQKTRDDEQSERQGHLSDDQAVLKAHARAATCENGFQGRAQLDVRSANGWYHPEDQEREGSHGQRERKHSSIKVCRKRHRPGRPKGEAY